MFGQKFQRYHCFKFVAKRYYFGLIAIIEQDETRFEMEHRANEIPNEVI